MSNKQFFVELKSNIDSENLKHLRMLYAPIIGIKATMIYQLFLDYHDVHIDFNTFYALSEISSITGMREEEILEARKKLEAVGLIRTFEKNDGNNFVVKINVPLDPVAFRKNGLLYQKSVKKIGDIVFERIEFANKTKQIDKKEFEEVTSKYQDVFSLKEHNYNTNIQNTLEIALPSYESKEEAMKGLSFSQFAYYLIGVRISPSQLSIFQNVANLGFSNYSLNLIIKYSFDVNGKIISNHVKKIAEDLFKKNIKGSGDVKKELENALDSKRSIISEPVTTVKRDKNKKESSSSNWNDIFDSLGGI